MSTTLVPPSYYLLTPRGHTARRYESLSQVAVALRLARSPTTVCAVTGNRLRSLTDAELRDLGRHVQAIRIRARRASAVQAVVSIHEREAERQ